MIPILRKSIATTRKKNVDLDSINTSLSHFLNALDKRSVSSSNDDDNQLHCSTTTCQQEDLIFDQQTETIYFHEDDDNPDESEVSVVVSENENETDKNGNQIHAKNEDEIQKEDQVATKRNRSIARLSLFSAPSFTNVSDQRSKQKTTANLETNKDRRMIFLGKCVVFGSIFLGGLIIAMFAYWHLRQNIEKKSRKAFTVIGATMSRALKFHAKEIIEANEALSRSITISAISNKETFPFASIRGFETFAHEARMRGKVEEVVFAPRVQEDELMEWFNFSSSHADWIVESLIVNDALAEHEIRRSASTSNLLRMLTLNSMDTLNSINNLASVYQSSMSEQKKLALIENLHTYFKYKEYTLFVYNESKKQIIPIAYDEPYLNQTNETNSSIASSTDSRLYYPTFQKSPPSFDESNLFQNVDLSSHKVFKELSIAASSLKECSFSRFGAHDAVVGWKAYNDEAIAFNERLRSIVSQPVYRTLDANKVDIVGFIFSFIDWGSLILNKLPDNIKGVQLVLSNTCNQSITFEVNGSNATFVSFGDLHDRSFEDEKIRISFTEFKAAKETNSSLQQGHCEVYFDVFPSRRFRELYDSALPAIFTVLTCIIFLAMAIIFLRYDNYVTNRQKKVLILASKSASLLASLFPSSVASRLLDDRSFLARKVHTQNRKSQNKDASSSHFGSQKEGSDGILNANTLKSILANLTTSSQYDHQSFLKDTTTSHIPKIYETKPIADLFPDTTILFADIVGFTAWSSIRQPSHVFTLLETIYHAFDEIAKRRRVFKVETIGDCYVAVCGIPDPISDHAVRMARFSRECMYRMWTVTKTLERTLGPDTGDLTMRMGLHSGPVTGGVLRGEKARFQLFGDTMNTASRIESTGMKDMVHISLETAELIINSGKMNWITPREDKVYAKGKGEISTYWLDIATKTETEDSPIYNPAQDEQNEFVVLDEKTIRLVSWCEESLLYLLKQIKLARDPKAIKANLNKTEATFSRRLATQPYKIIDEVKEIVVLPKYNPKLKIGNDEIASSVDLDEAVTDQLGMFVKEIASMYRDNSFHNFEHASHVTMSVIKLLSRIVAPSDSDLKARSDVIDSYSLHDHTYGITSDPLTQFSCVLSALIHDLDHPGVPNTQLVKENTISALRYNNKSIAEQNSVDIAWGILFLKKYKDLRAAIYSNEVELARFRQLVVNSVMATDIADKELKVARNARWDKAFCDKTTNTNSKMIDEHSNVNRKATIVIEHLIQASDVAHTMQHWQVYRKWNENFFLECYNAYKTGRADVDPSLSWYQGELGFFDYYIIPLANKLKECGVFGVSSDEYLNYALRNRAEWETRGEEIVNEMVENVNSMT